MPAVHFALQIIANVRQGFAGNREYLSITEAHDVDLRSYGASFV